MANTVTKFRRIRGRVVPIEQKASSPTTYRAAALGISVASGIVSGLTLTGSKKKIFAGQAASIGMDSAAAAISAAGYRKSNAPIGEKARAFAKDELVNQAVGWGTFGAVALTNPKVRKGLGEIGKKFATAIIARKLRGA